VYDIPAISASDRRFAALLSELAQTLAEHLRGLPPGSARTDGCRPNADSNDREGAEKANTSYCVSTAVATIVALRGKSKSR